MRGEGRGLVKLYLYCGGKQGRKGIDGKCTKRIRKRGKGGQGGRRTRGEGGGRLCECERPFVGERSEMEN